MWMIKDKKTEKFREVFERIAFVDDANIADELGKLKDYDVTKIDDVFNMKYAMTFGCSDTEHIMLNERCLKLKFKWSFFTGDIEEANAVLPEELTFCNNLCFEGYDCRMIHGLNDIY